MNFWPRYIGDIQRKTGHLSCTEMGVYDRLLDHVYATEEALPGDVEACCRIARAMDKHERKAVESVLRQFFKLDGGHYLNERAAEEIVKARPKMEAARANGLKGGRPRRTEQKPTGLPDGLPPGTHDEPKSKAPQNQSSSSLRSEEQPPARKRAAPPDRPDDVAEQVWADWLALRKAKRAPVTATTLDGARAEAVKAGMTLEAFLGVWCARGSQGLEAAWLKPAERAQRPAGPPAEPQWRTEQRARNVAFLGPAASAEARAAVAARTKETIEMEPQHAPATKLG